MQVFHYPHEELETGLARIRAAGWDVLGISSPTTLRQEKVPLWRVFALHRPIGQLQLDPSKCNSLIWTGNREIKLCNNNQSC